MSKLEDVYNGLVDLGDVDESWLHDQDSSRYHMVFGDKNCGCNENEYEDAEMEYYHECYSDEFHERFGYDYNYCGCDKK